jgi:hypothetical protein
MLERKQPGSIRRGKVWKEEEVLRRREECG